MSCFRLQSHCATWTVVALVSASASAQQTTPVIPTPSELGGRRLDVNTDPSRLPAPDAPPRQLARPDAEFKLDVVRYEVAADAPAPLRAALARLTAPYVGKDRTFDDVNDAAREVTRFLQSDLGYYLGFAYIPEQDPGNGVIRIVVLEGRLDSAKPYELKWNDGLPVRRGVVEAYLSQLRGGSVLRVRDIERIAFLVNDLRGITVEFEVRPGAAVGTATLVVTPRATPLTTWTLAGDNENSRYLGTTRASAGVVRNSPFGIGDSATANLIVSKGLTFALGNYTAPLGSTGMRLGLSLSALRYEVDKEAFPQGLEGTASTASLFALYPFVRSRSLNLFVVGSLDVKSYRDFDGANTTQKNAVVAGLGLTGDVRDSVWGGGINSLDAQVSTGQVKFDVPPASDAPDTNFTKLTLRGVRLQNIVSGRVQAYGSVRLQKAFNNLDVTEQFRVGGPDGVRAFPTGEGSGDSGALVTLELRVLPSAEMMRPVGGAAYFALFADRARVQRRNDTSAQNPTFVNNLNYGGWGLAATWNGPQGWDVRASLAKPTAGESANQADRTSKRFFLHVTKQF